MPPQLIFRREGRLPPLPPPPPPTGSIVYSCILYIAATQECWAQSNHNDILCMLMNASCMASAVILILIHAGLEGIMSLSIACIQSFDIHCITVIISMCMCSV